MQLNTVSIAPVIRSSSSSSSTRAPTALAQDYPSQSYTKKPKRKKKHRKKDREQPDLAAKLRAEAEANGERPSKRARTSGGKDEYDGTTTSGSAAANILAGNNQGRAYTVSVALPGSIVANAQSRELRTYLVGQIARSLAIFNIDEVVVYDDRSVASEEDSGKRRPYGDPCHFMARVLQYLETPQYLRKALFPVHEDLRYAGLLNPVDAPHHMRMDDRSKYREGVVLRPKKRQGDLSGDDKGSLVDVGLRNPIRVDRKLQTNIRVTVEIDAKKSRKSKLIGTIVRPATPRTKMGIYWGYDVRLATSLSEVWTGCPYGHGAATVGAGSASSSSSSSCGYDFVIGTSENGELASGKKQEAATKEGDQEEAPTTKVDLLNVKPFQHMLIVFGGLSGLESVVDSDEQLHVTKEDTSTLFDMYLNTCPAQGSRTIRTEEALLITMSLLRPYIQNNVVPKR